MDYQLTRHAQESLRKRSRIRIEWMEKVIQEPEKVEPDRVDSELEHRLGRVQAYENRVLRVVIKDLSRNNMPISHPIFGPSLNAPQSKKPQHSRAMPQLLLNRSVQIWPKSRREVVHGIS